MCNIRDQKTFFTSFCLWIFEINFEYACYHRHTHNPNIFFIIKIVKTILANRIGDKFRNDCIVYYSKKDYFNK